MWITTWIAIKLHLSQNQNNEKISGALSPKSKEIQNGHRDRKEVFINRK